MSSVPVEQRWLVTEHTLEQGQERGRVIKGILSILQPTGGTVPNPLDFLSNRFSRIILSLGWLFLPEHWLVGGTQT